jgi:CubicO group peptidase (beta-lactamase class C family)
VPTAAQISEAFKKEVAARVAAGDNPSMAVAVYQNGNTDYYVSGYQNTETKVLASTNTIYEIGSITKTFTALLFSKMALEGKVSLDTPITNFFPDSLKLKDPKGVPITFKHLATHTSGLISYPLGYVPEVQDNPYLNLDKKAIYGYLKNFGTQSVGTSFSYSNIAVGLFGEALAIIENKPYTTLITSEILTPLNLNNTFFVVPKNKTQQFADGYAKGKPTSHWDFDILAPAGALRADIKDLLAYGKSYLESNPLSEAQKATTETQYTTADGSVVLGINWFKKNNHIFHGGGTYGFSTHLEIDFENNRVVAIATNTGDQNISDLKDHLVDPEKYPLYSNDIETIKISEEIIQKYVGIYKNSQFGLTITVTNKDGQLYGQVTGQQAFLFTPIREDSFVNTQVKVKIDFETKDDTATGFTLFQGGQEIVLQKQ